jgi:hypothetical protein
MPSGTYARSDTISVPYTVKNVGEIQWCFLAESAITKSGGTYAYPGKWNSVSPGASASDTITYQVGCSDPTGTWYANLGSYTDGYSVGGWNVWFTSGASFQVVQCLNNADCSACLGSCYYCSTGNTCYYGCGGGPMFYKV